MLARKRFYESIVPLLQGFLITPALETRSKESPKSKSL